MSLPPARASTSKGTSSETENPVIMAKKIDKLCERIIDNYVDSPDLSNILKVLVHDSTSVIHNKHKEFVETILFQGLHLSPVGRSKIGVMITELLNMEIISLDVLTEGIAKVLTRGSTSMIPHLATRIADVLSALLTSTPQRFNLINLKDAYSSLSSDCRAHYFCELLRRISQTVTKEDGLEKKRGIFWAYKMWFNSENHLSIVEFVNTQHINDHFEDGQIGVFIMAAALSEQMAYISINNFVDSLKLWITNYISRKNILHALFTRALTIAIFILCSKHHHYSHDNFFHCIHMNLMAYYIQYRDRLVTEIIEREVQCLYGIQMMCTVFRHPDRLSQTLFRKLHRSLIICKDAFITWRDDRPGENNFFEDMQTKRSAIQVLSIFFDYLDTENVDPS